VEQLWLEQRNDATPGEKKRESVGGMGGKDLGKFQRRCVTVDVLLVDGDGCLWRAARNVTGRRCHCRRDKMIRIND
jgi:hypothetical protein